jgi:hypothetical protein
LLLLERQSEAIALVKELPIKPHLEQFLPLAPVMLHDSSTGDILYRLLAGVGKHESDAELERLACAAVDVILGMFVPMCLKSAYLAHTMEYLLPLRDRDLVSFQTLRRLLRIRLSI